MVPLKNNGDYSKVRKFYHCLGWRQCFANHTYQGYPTIVFFMMLSVLAKFTKVKFTHYHLISYLNTIRGQSLVCHLLRHVVQFFMEIFYNYVDLKSPTNELLGQLGAVWSVCCKVTTSKRYPKASFLAPASCRPIETLVEAWFSFCGLVTQVICGSCVLFAIASHHSN